MQLTKQCYQWKACAKTSKQYVQNCLVCQVMKPNCRKKTRLLQPIPIPTRKQEQIIIDFVADLPLSVGYIAIAIFVDYLTKMGHFAPYTKEISANQYA